MDGDDLSPQKTNGKYHLFCRDFTAVNPILSNAKRTGSRHSHVNTSPPTGEPLVLLKIVVWLCEAYKCLISLHGTWFSTTLPLHEVKDGESVEHVDDIFMVEMNVTFGVSPTFPLPTFVINLVEKNLE